MKSKRLHIIQTLTLCITVLSFIFSIGMTAHAEAVWIDVTNPPESITGGAGPFDGVTTPTVYPIQLEAVFDAGEETPGEKTPDEVTPDEGTPGEVTPGEETPGEVTSGEETPGEVTPGEETPGEDMPVVTMPDAKDLGIMAATLKDYAVSFATSGSEITLVVYAKEGYRFKEWRVVKGDITIKENTFIMPEGEVQIQAVFERETTTTTVGEYTITIEDSSREYVVTQLYTKELPVTTAPSNNTIRLRCIPRAGYRFKEWKVTKVSDSKEANGTTINNNDVFTMPEEDVIVSAVYEPLPTSTLTTSSKNGSITTLVNNTETAGAMEGTQVTLQPKPEASYRLKSIKVTSGNATIPVDNLTFIMPEGNVTITATFEEDPRIVWTADGTDTAIDRRAIQKALNTQNGNDALTVYVPAGTYYIDEPLRVRSNTTIQLADGAVIKRADDGLSRNMLITCQIVENANGSISYQAKSVGKYNLAQNIVIEGGTWDGGNISKAIDARNLFNIGHSSNVIIRNTTIQNCYGSHLIEFAGSKDCQVYNCVFTGFRKGNGSDAESIDSEAIQIDVCYTPDGAASWNDAFLSDKTACQNISITNNSFVNYPSAVGNHHQLSGSHNKNIVVSNNTITNTSGSNAPGIYLYGFDNSTVSYNAITGHSVGIKANNSFDYQLLYNNIANCKTYGVHSTGSSSGKIAYNTIKNTQRNGVYADANTKITSLSKNTLTKVGTSSGHSGIWITGSGTTVKTFSSNTISGAKEYGINVTSGAKVTTINKNTISDIKKSGIVVKNAGNKVKVKSNTLKNIKGTYAIKIDSTVNKSKHTYSANFKTTPVTRKKGNVVVTGKNLKKATIKAGSKSYSSNFKKEKATITHKKIAKKESSVTLTVTDKYKNSIVKTLTVK